MKGRTTLTIVAAFCGALVLFPFLTILFIPADEIKGVIKRGMEKDGYVFQAEKFSKSFPLGMTARNVMISEERGTIVKLDKTNLHVELLPLFIGRIIVDFTASIGEGEVQAEYMPRPNSITFQLRDILLENVPWFQITTGANLKGHLTVDGSFTGRGSKTEGELKMEVRKAELSAIKIGEIPLPDASYETIRGMFRAASGTGTLESFTFQGDGIYIRLKGTLPVSGPLESAPLNLTLELMPKPDFLERQKLVFLMLSKYQTTPGSYRIPVKGALMKPVIQ